MRGRGSKLSRCGCCGTGRAAGSGGVLGTSSARGLRCRALGQCQCSCPGPRGKEIAGPGLSAGLRNTAVLLCLPSSRLAGPARLQPCQLFREAVRSFRGAFNCHLPRKGLLKVTEKIALWARSPEQEFVPRSETSSGVS